MLSKTVSLYLLQANAKQIFSYMDMRLFNTSKTCHNMATEYFKHTVFITE